MAFPDLLHREPLPTRQGPALSEALTFGFARGVDPARLLALAAPTLASSSFEQAAFASDLFITELIRGCFPLKVGSSVSAPTVDFFRNVLLAPPRELEDTRFRQEIFRELLRVPERRQGLEGAYRELLAFRDALCGSDTFGTRALGVRRRLDVLLAFRNATMALGAVTGTATSGLSRLSSWVDQIKTKQSFRALLQLLDFENGRAVLETRLQAGYDGTLRRFDVVGVALMEHEAFPRGAIARFFGRLVSLLKGYRFSEEDIMATLLDRVFADLEEEVICLLGILLELEFYLRGLSFHDLCQRSGLAVCLPELRAALDEGGHCEIKNLFNPWLVADEGTEVVPCDVELSRFNSVVIVTGPNSGGKTRLLQSLAVLQLLAQVGLFVPASRARLFAVDQLFLSLLEHSGPQQSEGRLGLELLRIRQVFETTGPRALVLMDELCSGTNPSEGERIFEMVLELLEELGPQVWITTHFLDFAARLLQKNLKYLRFLQVQLGANHLPTYQFVPGVAQTSLARNTAARLGVTREELVELIHRRRVTRRLS